MAEEIGRSVDLEGVADSRYRAFLSYSHADDAIARRLHRRLETYRLPKTLSGSNQGAEESNRLGPIFRDREDFPAAVDLSESVKQALDIAGALIVLCSPDARASPWVAKEIAYFRDRHPDRPILAALLRGEPGEAFPDALTEGAEPLAADLRPGGDGPRIGFLKLVAGLAGVPLDALVQRDAQRRVRRVTAVTLASLVALIVMAGMTILALQSRNQAERQRAEAEGLIEYMLTDLRQDLRGVGRLDVMTDVNQRAMEYYEGQGNLSRLGADSLERRARILHAMGEDDEHRGDLDAALAKFREAHRVTEELLAREPDNADRIFAHAQSQYWLGYIAYLQQNWTRTEQFWRAYKSLADRLTALDSRNSDWLREAGYAEGNLCTLGLARDDQRANLLANCRTSLTRMQAVAALDPQDLSAQLDVANRHAWLADAFAIRGDRRRERAQRFERARIVEELVEQNPQNFDVLDVWVVVQTEIARFETPARARDRLDRAERLAALMIRHDPENGGWLQRLELVRTVRTEVTGN